MSGKPASPSEEAALLRSIADRIENGSIPVPENLWGGAARRQTEQTLVEPHSDSVDQLRELQKQIVSKDDVAASLRALASHIERTS